MNQDHLNVFEPLFKTHFEPLCRFALKYIEDLDDAKGVVHDVFVTVWEKFDSLSPDLNYKSYLYTAVRNRCLNVIRDNKKFVSLDVAESNATTENNTLETKELELEIARAVDSLPEKCREVFEKSRIEGLKYAQIATEMNISVKTVEAHMSKALRVLRKHLAEFLSLTFFLLDK